MPRSFSLKKLCTPAMLYFVISFVGLFLIGLNNINQSDMLCLGNFECNVGNNNYVFIVHAAYILFWTFVLDLMCKNGWTDLSWFLLLLPFILSFCFTGFYFLSLVDLSLKIK